jgi:hypothetical protein
MKHVKTFQLWEGKKRNPEKYKTGDYKWYDAEEFLKLIDAVAAKAPDMEWGTPSDIYGHATHYAKFEEAKSELEKWVKYWSDRKDPVKLCIWSIDDSRLNYINSTRLLASGLEKLAEFVEPGKSKRVSITMNNKGISDFGAAMSRGDYGSLD